MVKAVIFDLNGVFIVSKKLSERFHDDYGVNLEEFLVALKVVMGQVRLPDAPEAYDLWKPYLDKWKVNLDRDQFYQYWFKAETENKELVEVAKELKDKGIKIFILSNNFRERTNYYNQQFPDLLNMFDKAYFSWQTGFIKPDERCFKLLLDENNLKPDECLYFDDSKHNIEVAKLLGIGAHVFSDPDELKEILGTRI